ncbi:hypothetical protein DK847_16640 [Aestuariivirga litoralis]|uniref:Uncharacterized protein n=1 Tax=Aestuariivirga litoralis TaxID=2650924 RepID=A0A2W2B703_9HYPH|nr:hypothetical protein [Aestuariivirga litoralis]PZF75848.1 hypothetical protein DK847_16640 [Aestuariivirga litoralis]
MSFLVSLASISAVFAPLNGSKQTLENLEVFAIRIAPSLAALWTDSTEIAYSETSDLVNDMVQRLGSGPSKEKQWSINLLCQATRRSLIPGRGKRLTEGKITFLH